MCVWTRALIRHWSAGCGLFTSCLRFGWVNEVKGRWQRWTDARQHSPSDLTGEQCRAWCVWAASDTVKAVTDVLVIAGLQLQLWAFKMSINFTRFGPLPQLQFDLLHLQQQDICNCHLEKMFSVLGVLLVSMQLIFIKIRHSELTEQAKQATCKLSDMFC